MSPREVVTGSTPLLWQLHHLDTFRSFRLRHARNPLTPSDDLAQCQKCFSVMDATAPVIDPSLAENTRTDGRSTFCSLDNVLALLDEERSRQLLQRVIPAVTYTGPFEVVGRVDGLDPPIQLCSPCKRLVQHPPPIYSSDEEKIPFELPPERFWIPHHDTLFQLIDCCFSQSGSCRLCHLFWHGLRRETVRHRSEKSGNSRLKWHDGGLKVAIQEVSEVRYGLGLNILDRPYGFLMNFHLRMTHCA